MGLTSRRPSAPASLYMPQLRSVRRSVPRSVLQLLVTSLVLTQKLRKCQPRRHPAASAQSTSVDDELRCSAGILIVAVRSHHSTSTPTALVEGKGANSSSLSLSTRVNTEQHRRTYLADELSQPADFEARRHLRFASSSSLIVHCTRLSTIGDRAFPVAAVCIWNSLPQHVMSASSLSVFRSRLKTHLYRRCYPRLHPSP